MSQYLHQEHGYRILGLESDESRVATALSRQNKFYPESKAHVKYTPHFVTEDSTKFILDSVRAAFDCTDTSIGLIGLHACADLTITAIKLVCCQNNTAGLHINRVVIMPCCYHKMSLINENEFANFPLSVTLCRAFNDDQSWTRNGAPSGNSSHAFGRPFLRLACQQSARNWQKMTEFKHLRHGREMFGRALVDTLLSDGMKIFENN